MPYYLQHHGQQLWVIHRKVASTSLLVMLGEYDELSKEEAMGLSKPVMSVVRHPWDRLVSALYSVLRSLDPLDERIAQYTEGFSVEQMNSHIRPQSFELEGFKIVWLVPYEELSLHFPSLEHRREGKHRPSRWQDAAIDWMRWFPIWKEDFRLCPVWSPYPGK